MICTILFKLTTPITLADVERFACGTADEATQIRVAEALKDSGSDLSRMLRAIRDPAISLLSDVAGKQNTKPDR
jgi:hypothetical protein